MLLQDSSEKKRLFSLFSKRISKGELIQMTEFGQWIVAYSKPPIVVNCRTDQVKNMDPVFFPYLLAIESLNSRYNLFVNELSSLSKNILLKAGDKVDVMMEQEVIPTTGVVRYIGNLPRKKGDYFGIEIMVSQYYSIYKVCHVIPS